MLTSALPTSAVNPVTSSYNGAPSSPSSGTSEAAPDGFARMLDQASKPDAANGPERDTETGGDSVSHDSAGGAGSGGTAEASPNEGGPGTVDLRSPPWTPGPKPVKGQHPPITPPPGHLPVRLPPVPGDDGTAGTLSDTLTAIGRDARAKDQTDAGSGLSDAAAASLATAATPTSAPPPDSASALLATLQAGAAAAAQALAASGSPERAGNGPDSDGARACGAASIDAIAITAVRSGQLTDGAPDAGPDSGRSPSLAPAGGARVAASSGSGGAGRAERLAAVASTLAQTGTSEGTAVQGLETDLQPDAANGQVNAERDTAARRRGATAEAATPTTEQAALQAATQTARHAASQSATQMAIDSAARSANPAAEAAAGNTANALEAAGTVNNANGTGPNTVAGTPRRGAADAKTEGGATRVQTGADGATRSNGNSAAITATSFNAEARANTPTPAHADLHGGVAAATAQAAASAALASAAGAVLREAGGSLPRSAEAQRESTAVTAGAGSTGGLPTAGALAWITGAAAGAPAPAAASDGRIAASPGSPDFAPQLAAHISTFVQGGVQHARLELNPGEMGPLTVQIQLDGNAARVHLAAEHAGTRAALEQAMPQLAGSLRENGLTLSGGGVFEQPRPQQQAQAGDGRSGNNNGSGNDSPRDSRSGAAREAATGGVIGAIAASAATGRRHAGVVDLVA